MNSSKDKKQKTLRRQQVEALERKKAQNDPHIKKLTQDLEKLKVAYEQHFIGIEKTPPRQGHKRFQRELVKLNRVALKSATDSFRIKNLVSSHQTLSIYWKRTLRSIENGTHKRIRFRAKHGLDTKTTIKNDPITKLYADLEKQLKGHKLNIDRDEFETFAKQQIKDIQKKSGNKIKSFKVTFNEGQVKLVADQNYS